MGNSERDIATFERVKELFAKKVATTAGMKSYYAITKKKDWNAEYQYIADFCNQNNVDPRPFIDWVFARYYPKLPQSIRLLNGFTYKYLEAGKPDVEYVRTNILFENMADRLSRCDSEDVVSYLLDPRNEFSCVFVCCAANQLSLLAKLPEALLQCAKDEIFLKPVYKAKFSELLPREFS